MQVLPRRLGAGEVAAAHCLRAVQAEIQVIPVKVIPVKVKSNTSKTTITAKKRGEADVQS